MDYQQKYLKYKNKYLELKEQIGGENNLKNIKTNTIKAITDYINNNKDIIKMSDKDKKEQIKLYKSHINKLNPKQTEQLLWLYNSNKTNYINNDIFNKIDIISQNFINGFDENKTKMFFNILEQIFLKMSQKENNNLKNNYIIVINILKYIINKDLFKESDFTDEKQKLFGNILGEFCNKDQKNIIIWDNDAYYNIIINIINIINIISKEDLKNFSNDKIIIIADFYEYSETDYDKIYALIDYIDKNIESIKENKNKQYHDDKIYDYYIEIKKNKLNQLLNDKDKLEEINKLIEQLNDIIKEYNGGDKFKLRDDYTEIINIEYGRTLNTRANKINQELKKINPLLDYPLNFPLIDVYNYKNIGLFTTDKQTKELRKMTDTEKQQKIQEVNVEFKKKEHHREIIQLLTKDSFKPKK